MSAALLGRRRKRRAQPLTRQCMACPAKIDRWKWLCDACFRAIPGNLRSAICTARQERAPQRVYGHSFEAAKWLIEKRAEAAER